MSVRELDVEGPGVNKMFLIHNLFEFYARRYLHFFWSDLRPFQKSWIRPSLTFLFR